MGIEPGGYWSREYDPARDCRSSPGALSFDAMQFRIFRRWLVLCVVAALTLGQVAQAFAMSSMGPNMPLAVTSGKGAPMAPGCDRCGDGDDAMPAAGCLALCTGAIAILPSVNPSKVVAAKQLPIAVVRVGGGRDSSPDPYPPRRTILS